MIMAAGRIERRLRQRVPFGEFVRVGANGDKRRRFIARDLSFSGLSFYCEEDLHTDDNEIEVLLSPPAGFIDGLFDSGCRLRGRIIGARVDREASKRYLAVSFADDLTALTKMIYRSRIRKALLLSPVVLSAILFLKYLNVKYYWYQPLGNIYSLTVGIYLLSRFAVSFFYKPPKDSGHTPSLSVAIPVKNEEKIIAQAIARCFSANYPKDKLEVIVVNDGSDDATLDEIKKCEELYPELKVIDFKEHKGKRQAIAAAVALSKGEIVACLDSDSLLHKDALYYLVQGFAEPSVGAVCGQAYILNSDENILTRMQEVRNFIAFKVIKAAEHVFSLVTCCSGSLSAYRREYLARVMDKWLNQTFLGKAATFGDDRSLTNLILGEYRVLYDDRAVVETAAPSGWKKFFHQQLRWKKSWFRESLNACRFIWRKHPAASLPFYAGFILPIISPLVVFKVLVYQPLFLGRISHGYALGLGLMSLLFSLYYLCKRPNKKWIYGICFCVLYTTLLSWQIYYAIITCRKNHWGTR